MCTNLLIEMLPSSYGESFLIHYGLNLHKHMVIDFGFSTTYYCHLKNKLIDIHKKQEKLSLVIITHIDSDHINGVVPFLQENGSSSSPKIIAVNEIWHNSLLNMIANLKPSSIINDLNDELYLKSILLVGYPQEDGFITPKSIGVTQGQAVCNLLLKEQYLWNKSFRNKAVVVDENSTDLPVINIDEDLSITILTPIVSKLATLMKFWKSKLFELGIKKLITNEIYSTAFEYWTAQNGASETDTYIRDINIVQKIERIIEQPFIEDDAIGNGSSMSFILSFNEKTVLFMGDAHPSDIEQSIKKISNTDKLCFNAIKVSHHGSSGSMSPSLLELIDAEYYLISTNGHKYNHPSQETIARIIARPPLNSSRVLVFNYKTETSTFFENPEYQREYKYEIKYDQSVRL